MNKIVSLIIIVIGFSYNSCISHKEERTKTVEISSLAKPNILWLTCEDISPTLSMYGDSTAQTPNLDKLAAESLIFNQAFATVGVCAPARSSIITGMYPISIGTHNMRTGRDYAGWGQRRYDGKSTARDINNEIVPLYSAVIPADVRCFTEYLRSEGYYCTNNAKTDYQFAPPVTAWDASGNNAHWNNREENQPFFSVFNHEITHESRMWMNKALELTVDPKDVPIPDYYPDTKTVRRDVARNYSNIELLDAKIGEKIEELKKEGLLENTIIFFFSDHGGPLPRGKREHYESGLRVPFMVRIPDRLKNEYTDQLISFVDLAPTMLSLANIDIPDHMQGQPFLGNGKQKVERDYVFGSGDRFDEFTDRSRSVINEDYIYVRNYHVELPAYKDVEYRKGIDMMMELLELNAAGRLNKKQQYWFRKNKKKEEFYVRESDPLNLNNLIDDAKHSEQIQMMSKAMDAWLSEVGDLGAMPEKELFLQMWPNGVQPETMKPTMERKANSLRLSCNTEGASIAYILSKEEIELDLDSGWKVYSEPIDIQEGDYVYAMSTRIGFKDSEIVQTIY
ncbi:MAG: sulfatase [Reichenbachiella sp.]